MGITNDFKKFFGANYDFIKAEDNEIVTQLEDSVAIVKELKKQGYTPTPDMIKVVSDAMAKTQAEQEAKAAYDAGFALGEIMKNAMSFTPPPSLSYAVSSATGGAKSPLTNLTPQTTCVICSALAEKEATEIQIEGIFLCELDLCEDCACSFADHRSILIKFLKEEGIIV